MIDVQALRDGAAGLGVDLGEAACKKLVRYGDLLLKWNRVYNLTALREPSLVLTHHLLDSLAVVRPLARERGGRSSLLDVGSGAGLPGAVIAMVAEEVTVTCVDAVAKKAAFVQQVAAELELVNLQGLHARVEDMKGEYDLIASRAFATLGDFIEKTAHLLKNDGLWMAMKGKVPSKEIQDLSKQVEVFHVEHLIVPGLDAERCVIWARKAPS